MSEQPETIKLKRITIKTESGSGWFDAQNKSMAWQLLTANRRWSSPNNSWLATRHAFCNQNFPAMVSWQRIFLTKREADQTLALNL